MASSLYFTKKFSSGVRAFARTDRQTAMMNIILDAADAGETLTFETFRDRVPWKDNCSTSAIRCSLNYLEKYGMVSKNYKPGKSRGRMILTPTLLAYQTFRTTPPLE